MIKYEVIIYWSEEDQAFIAEVPELSGCMADGTTAQEALSNAEVIAPSGSKLPTNWDAPSLSQRVG